MNKNELIKQIEEYKKIYPFFFLPLTDPFSKEEAAGKRPILLNWQKIENVDFKKELKLGKNYNLGVRTGISSGIIVIDFDMETKTAFENGIPSELASSPYWIKTGSGKGYHYYFKYHSKPQSMDLLKIVIDGEEKKVELKSAGKQVVFPPSVHPKTKKTYEFGVHWNKEKFDPPEFPVEALDKYLKSREISEGRINVSSTAGVSLSPYIDIERIMKAKKGDRDESFFDLAVAFRNNNIPKEFCKNLLVSFERYKRESQSGYEPFATKTIAEKVNSAYSKNAPVEIKLTSPDELLLSTREWIKNNKKSKSFKTSLKTLDERLHGFMEGNIYIITAMPGRGKSFFTNQIFLENINNDKCMFISTEMTPQNMLVRSVQRETDMDYVDISFDSLSPKQRELANEEMDLIIQRLKEHESSYESYGVEKDSIFAGIKMAIDNGYKFIILDHIHNIHCNAKSEYEFFSSIYHELQGIAVSNQICVLVADQISIETQNEMNMETINVKSTSEGKNVASGVLVLARDIIEDEDKKVDINFLKINLAKNRFGRSKTVRARIDFPSGKITEELIEQGGVSFTDI